LTCTRRVRRICLLEEKGKEKKITREKKKEAGARWPYAQEKGPILARVGKEEKKRWLERKKKGCRSCYTKYRLGKKKKNGRSCQYHCGERKKKKVEGKDLAQRRGVGSHLVSRASHGGKEKGKRKSFYLSGVQKKRGKGEENRGGKISGESNF